jgi:epsilon-lactone hydrolase
MPSKQAEELKELYRDWAEAGAKNPEMTLDERREMVEHWEVVTGEPREVDYIETDAGGVPAMWAVPKGCAEDRVILCLHGGGFVTGSMYTHRKLFAHLAKAVGARALIPNYRLSPENTYPAALDDAFTTYSWLVEQGIEPKHIALTGDSSGGGLAITLLLRLRASELSLPAASMPLSPWVDMEVSGDSMVSNRDKDPFFLAETVQALVELYLGEEGDRKDPLANPLYADLSGLPPIYIQVGGDETLVDDSRRLLDRLKEAGGDEDRLEVFPEMQHTFQFCAGRAPDADDAINKLADWVRPKLGLNSRWAIDN